MYKFRIYLLASILCCACTSRPHCTDNRTLYVSIQPLRSLVKGIVGEDFSIEVLVPPGASPETFEPTARQIASLNRSGLIFNVGLLDFETTLVSKIGASDKIVNLNEGIELLEGSCSHKHSHSHTHATAHAHGIDPHIWTSPKALQRMATNVYNAIHRLYPDSAKYGDAHERLQKRLQELEIRTAEKIAKGNVRYFIIYHPAFTYYARDYGLQQKAIETDGKEPSAKHLAALIREARADGIRRIFYQSQFPASTVEVIARDIDAVAVRIDPLREEIIDEIDRLTDLITEK